MARGIAIPVSDEDLARAVGQSDSWRDVLRQLGYATTNGRTSAMLRQRASEGTPYDPDDIDFFFIVDADGVYYLVPIEEVAGQVSVSLNTLEHRRINGCS
jgi:hypothetical protein